MVPSCRIPAFTSRLTSVLAAVALLLSLAVATPAVATEFGGGTYPNGAEGILAGALPPAGFYYLNYTTWYGADQLNDGDGDKLPVDFDLDVTANVFRFIYMTEHKVLGADFGMYLTVPLLHVEASVATPGGTLSDTDSGLGDISFTPCLLAWHSKNFHLATAIDIVVPTGDFDEDDLANVGRNYWTVQPIVAFSWLPDNGFELSAKMMYDINSENRDTDYRSGQEFHFDYAAAYHLKAWTLGVAGYYYKQLTDDHGGLARLNNGNRGQVLAVGPTLHYGYKNMSLEARYQRELEVENRPEGDKLWLKLVWAF